MKNSKKGINEIIKEYPMIAKFLSYNGIDCVSCTIGTCKLENVLDVHDFSKHDQTKMYNHIEKIINNETDEMVKFIPEAKSNDFKPITNILMEEHIYIKELIYVLDYIVTKKDFLNYYKEPLSKVLEYIKTFADELHHMKEEDLLFNLFEDNEVVQLMLEDHELGRNYRKTIISSSDEFVVKDTIKKFSSLLKEHIRKEDEILFPYLDKHLTEEQNDNINQVIKKQDKELQEEVKRYLNDFNNKEFNI